MKINYPAVIVAAIVHWILGAVWYGIFTKQFVTLMEWTPEKMREIESQNHAKEYAFAFLSSLVLVYILAHFVQYTKAKNALDGLQTAFWIWLGFIATTQIATVIFEGRKPELYLLNIGYQFVACSLASVILAIWRPREAADSAAQPA
jgi:uncharacterized protein DUF1761